MVSIKCCNPKCKASKVKFSLDLSILEKITPLREKDSELLSVKCPICGVDNIIDLTKLRKNDKLKDRGFSDLPGDPTTAPESVDLAGDPTTPGRTDLP
jgi:hypothetical protein